MKISWMRKTVFLTVVATLLWCGISQASLTYTTIPFTYNGYNWERGANYPTGSGDIFGIGIPFNIPSSPNNNTWDSAVWLAGPQTLTIPVNITGVQKVFTLINCTWGYSGSQLTTLDFDWSGGLTVHKVLVGGTDIRDSFQGNYTNTIASPTVNVYTDPVAYGHPRVDMKPLPSMVPSTPVEPFWILSSPIPVTDQFNAPYYMA